MSGRKTGRPACTVLSPSTPLNSTVLACSYCYYAETQNILGNTYGMAVLQV
jgi:tRNA(Met) C34 N-acetyltransferase TmcA